MEDSDEKDFTNFFKEIGGSAALGKKIYNEYWKVDAKDRFEWDTEEWLSKYGIK